MEVGRRAANDAANLAAKVMDSAYTLIDATVSQLRTRSFTQIARATSIAAVDRKGSGIHQP